MKWRGEYSHPLSLTSTDHRKEELNSTNGLSIGKDLATLKKKLSFQYDENKME